MTMTVDEWKLEAWLDRQDRRKHACQCGGDMPGTCPGPENCPMVADEEDGDEH